MAIFGSSAVVGGNHGIAQSSLLKATLSGHIWDVKVSNVTTSGTTTTYTPIEVDNGVAVTVLGFTGDGLQERYGKIAGVKDKIGFVCSAPIVRDASTAAYEEEGYFYHKAGELAKVYEVVGDKYDPDIIGVSDNLFTTGSAANIKKDAYVVLDGNGKYVAQAAAPTAANYGFIGQIHSIHEGLYYRLVRIAVIQNVDNNN